MAEAYAALISVMHLIDDIQLHPNPPISLNQKQVESLTENITFFQDFLEVHPHDLDSRISDAAHATEDLIESNIVDRIHGRFTSNYEENNNDFDRDLQQIIQDMDSIKIKLTKDVEDGNFPRGYSMLPVSSSRLSSSTRENMMVGFDDFLIEIMDKLTSQQSNRQIIPIVGMGGIGKTTLARNAYINPLIVEYFDICAWITVSQVYNMGEIFLEVLVNSNKHETSEKLSAMSEKELGEKIHKSLWGQRYFIVMDDLWSIEPWDMLNMFLPDNKNGSRVMITTRLSKLACHLIGSNGFEMKLLDDDKSWIMFSRKVFGEGVCPPELEEIGKKIANNCKGLPLSIVVIGGLLRKSKMMLKYWEYVAKNLNEIFELEDYAFCLKILSLSYINLPIHLKPCFLYIGVFLEDTRFKVSLLIKLWVTEGFLKPISGQSLEMVAKDYLNDLIDRNLILVDELGSSGKTKFCKIHDLLRDLCLREAQKEKFLYIATENSHAQCINTQRRIVVNPSSSNDDQLLHGLRSTSIARSVICSLKGYLPLLNCRLLRVLEYHKRQFYLGKSREEFIRDIFQLVNLRHLAINVGQFGTRVKFPSSMSLLWNLQILVVNGIGKFAVALPEIWQMPQLRHVQFFHLHIPDPPNGIILRNLQTLYEIRNFEFSEDVVKRIPNVKKLGVYYEGSKDESRRHGLNNLGHLHKLESLYCAFNLVDKPCLEDVAFPHSIRKLTLEGTFLDWEEMSNKIGSLPLLQVLKLRLGSCKGDRWEPVEGQFCSLKYLFINDYDLIYWTTDETNFTCLEHLVLEGLVMLNEVPSGIGDIPTLRSIEMKYCSTSAVMSVRKIVDEQEELGNLDLQVQVSDFWINDDGFLKSLASPNFHVRIIQPNLLS